MKVTPFDTSSHLDHPTVIACYLREAVRSRDRKLILRAMRNVARALMRRLK